MFKEPTSRVVPGLREAGVRTTTKEPVWLEVPGGAELVQLEEDAGCTFSTFGVFPDMLQLALIEWTVKHGRPEQPQQGHAEGCKLPIPVVRQLQGGNLQLLAGAETVFALRDVEPRADGRFPVLLASV